MSHSYQKAKLDLIRSYYLTRQDQVKRYPRVDDLPIIEPVKSSEQLSRDKLLNFTIMLGTYYYSHTAEVYPKLQFIRLKMRVEVLSETEKSYRIKYLGKHANGRGPGYISLVHKKSVVLDGQTHAPNIEDVRLPYKD